jgi:hypothetical protein
MAGLSRPSSWPGLAVRKDGVLSHAYVPAMTNEGFVPGYDDSI